MAGVAGSSANRAVPRVAAPAAAVRVIQADTRTLRRAFLRVPWLTQGDDPAWVPPLLAERAAFVNRRHPFHAHGESTLLLALRDGRPVGRILASVDPRHDALHGERVAFFGLFESVRDPGVAHALLDAAAEFGRARGKRLLVGPVDYGIHYQSGLLVSGFQHPPRLMTNHNPPWYAPLLESWGLAKRKDLHGWRLRVGGADPVPPRFRALAPRLRARAGLTIRPARLRDFEAEIGRLKRVYDGAWAGTFGFVPTSEAEFRQLARDLRRLVVPDLLLLAEVGGEPVGFSLTLPDVNEAIGPLDGRLTTFGLPIGLVRLLLGLRRVRALRMLTLGVLPAWRRRGVAELLMLESHDAALRLGYREAELGWTAEDNELIEGPIRAFGAEPYKTWRIYARAIDGAGAPP